VNGIVASGLGDGEELNELFPRQEVWKQATAAQAEVEDVVKTMLFAA